VLKVESCLSIILAIHSLCQLMQHGSISSNHFLTSCFGVADNYFIATPIGSRTLP
jgi:hypothetical protein